MKAFEKILPYVSIKIGSFLYDPNYIRGGQFSGGGEGWKWIVKGIWFQKILGFNRRIPWPCSPFARIGDHRKIHFHVDDINNFQSPGIYMQTIGGEIWIGRGALIAPNVGIITANHDVKEISYHSDGGDVEIGPKCWIGMNSVILPGVRLGESTIVAAGSVVNKSFCEGNVIIGGAPAKIIKFINN